MCCRLQPSPESREKQAWTLGWAQYVGTTGRTIGMETFRASAPLKELQRKAGFTPESVVAAAKEQLTRTRRTMRIAIGADQAELRRE